MAHFLVFLIISLLKGLNLAQNTDARDFCWQYTDETDCGNAIIPESALAAPLGTFSNPGCEWVSIQYIDGCRYLNDTFAVPGNESSGNNFCAGEIKPGHAPDYVCVPDDCALYELDESACNNAELCEWVVNDRTLFDSGRCMSKCFNKADVMILLDGSGSNGAEVDSNLEQLAIFIENLPEDHVDPETWIIREYMIAFTGPLGDQSFNDYRKGEQQVPFTFEDSLSLTNTELGNLVRTLQDDSVFDPRGGTPLRFNVYNATRRYNESTLGDHERFFLIITDGAGTAYYYVPPLFPFDPEDSTFRSTSETQGFSPCTICDCQINPLDIELLGFVPLSEYPNGANVENVNCLTYEGRTSSVNAGDNPDVLPFGVGNAVVEVKRRVRNLNQKQCYMETDSPTMVPTVNPTTTPTKSPTKSPTRSPTKYPSKSPTKSPTQSPTKSPTKYPTRSPTITPSTQKPTKKPSWWSKKKDIKDSKSKSSSSSKRGSSKRRSESRGEEEEENEGKSRGRDQGRDEDEGRRRENNDDRDDNRRNNQQTGKGNNNDDQQQTGKGNNGQNNGGKGNNCNQQANNGQNNGGKGNNNQQQTGKGNNGNQQVNNDQNNGAKGNNGQNNGAKGNNGKGRR